MTNYTLMHQLKRHFIAIISLVIAIIALSYDTWRNEETEKNRNIREAGFEVLKHLSELQFAVNNITYEHENSRLTPYVAWSHISLIGDLSRLLPEPVPETVNQMIVVWGENRKKMDNDEKSADAISEQIDNSRNAVLKVLYSIK